MEIKKMDCPSCGASIELDLKKKSGKCKYCNAPYIFDDGTIRVEHSFSNEDSKRIIDNANVALYKYKDYKKSLPLFIQLFEKYQDNTDYLLGVILSLTEHFEKKDYEKNEANKVFYYWDMFEKVGKEEDIEKYKKDIKKINDIIEAKNKKKKENIKLVLIIIVSSAILSLIVFCILYFTKPSKKDVVVKMSTFETEVNNLVNKPFLKCTYESYHIDGKKLNVTYLCGNIMQYTKEYVFSYEFIDDEPPYVENINNIVVDERDTLNHRSIFVKDAVDGRIDDIEVDETGADFTKVGTTSVMVTAKDKSGNVMKTKVDIKVQKIKITKMTLNVSGTSHNVAGTAKASVVFEPAKLFNKTVTYSSSDNSIATIDAAGNIKFKKSGNVLFCAKSNYNTALESCKSINVYAQCKSTYVFNLDASKSNTLYANDDYCPGTYALYAPSVLNYDEIYHVDISLEGGYFADKTITVWKNASYLNDEGYKASLGSESSIVVPAGIKSFKLVKVR